MVKVFDDASNDENENFRSESSVNRAWHMNVVCPSPMDGGGKKIDIRRHPRSRELLKGE